MLLFDSKVTANQTQNLFSDRKRILLERRVKLPILLGPGTGRWYMLDCLALTLTFEKLDLLPFSFS